MPSGTSVGHQPCRTLHVYTKKTYTAVTDDTPHTSYNIFFDQAKLNKIYTCKNSL